MRCTDCDARMVRATELPEIRGSLRAGDLCCPDCDRVVRREERVEAAGDGAG